MPKPAIRARFTPLPYRPLDLFGTGAQSRMHYDIPPFQRDYSWAMPRWRDLWRDVARKAHAGSEGPQHFLGVLLLQDTGVAGTAGASTVRVIDGQQRLLTLAMLLAALKDEGADLAVDAHEVDHHSRWSGSNQATLDLLARAWTGAFASGLPRDAWEAPLAQAYRYFRYQIRLGRPRGADAAHQLPAMPPLRSSLPVESLPKSAPKARRWDLKAIVHAVQNEMVIVAIHLPPEEEEATGVFESLNGANTPLLEFDKVRVLVYTRAEGTKVYREEWQPAESTLLQTQYRGKTRSIGDQFMYDYTVADVRAFWPDGQPSATRTHEAFKEHALRRGGLTPATFAKNILKPMALNAKIYPLAVGVQSELDQAVDEYGFPEAAARSIMAICSYSSGPVTPLVMRLIAHWWSDHKDVRLTSGLQALEGALIRIHLSATKLSPLRSGMIRLSGELAGSFAIPDLREKLRAMLKNMEVPDDKTIRSSSREVELYGRISRSAAAQLLRSGDHFKITNVSNELRLGSKKKDFTIEHVLPKVEKLPASWRTEMAAWGLTPPEVKEAQRYRHTLGNLVLLQRADNSGFGTKAFSVKVEMLRESTEQLQMYRTVTNKRRWTADEIAKRGENLAKALLAARPL